MASQEHQKAMAYIYGWKRPFTVEGTCPHCEFFVENTCAYSGQCAVHET
jgi:hypothetical protein